MTGDLMDIAIANARGIGALVVLLALAVVFLVQNGGSVPKSRGRFRVRS